MADDIENMKFNTAIATLMALVNDFYANGVNRADMKALLLMLSPFAPHIVEEMWEHLGFAGEGMACTAVTGPPMTQSKTVDAEVTIAVQVCGKMKNTIQAPVDSEEDAVLAAGQGRQQGGQGHRGQESGQGDLREESLDQPDRQIKPDREKTLILLKKSISSLTKEQGISYNTTVKAIRMALKCCS